MGLGSDESVRFVSGLIELTRIFLNEPYKIWENFFGMFYMVVYLWYLVVSLSYCGLMTPYGNMNLDQHWFR